MDSSNDQLGKENGYDTFDFSIGNEKTNYSKC